MLQERISLNVPMPIVSGVAEDAVSSVLQRFFSASQAADTVIPPRPLNPVKLMSRGEHAVRTEFDRPFPSMVRGKFIPSVDHQTPPAVSYDAYLTYMRLFRESAQRAAEVRSKENMFEP